MVLVDPAIRRVVVRAVVCLTLLLMSACASNPERNYYLLEDHFIPTADQQWSTRLLGIKSIRLPDYGQGRRIVTRESDGQLFLDRNHLWAQSPAQSISTTLSEHLRAKTGAAVIGVPWPAGGRPDFSVEIRFEHLYRDVSGGAILAGTVFLEDPASRNLTQQYFSIERQAEGDSYAGFMQALSLALGDLSDTIVLGMTQENVQPRPNAEQ